MKPINWVGSSKNDLSEFPGDAKEVAGFQLYQVQQGLAPDDFSALPDVGTGAYEIRVQIGEDFRVIYVAKWDNAVYVLHAFHKKSRRIPPSDLAVAKKRYRDAKTHADSVKKSQGNNR